SQRLHPIRRLIAVGSCQRPAVLALRRTAYAPQRRPSTPPCIPPRKPGPNLSLRLILNREYQGLRSRSQATEWRWLIIYQEKGLSNSSAPRHDLAWIFHKQ